MKKTIVDGLAHTMDESTELCIYHLRMAYAHFMNGAEKLSDFNQELSRQCEESYGLPDECGIHSLWLSGMYDYHEQLKKSI